MKKSKKTENTNNKIKILNKEIANPIWLSVSESAKLSGVNGKTVRRAIAAHKLKYKVVKNRYLIDLSSLIKFIYTYKKLINKLNTYGIGQYINSWRE